MANLTALGPQRLIATSSGSYSDLAVTTALPNGNIAALTLREHYPNGEAVTLYRLQIRDSLSHALVATQTLNFAATGIASLPVIQGLTDGHFLVVWTSNYAPATGRGVWMAEFDSMGHPASAPTLVSPLGVNCELQSVTPLPDGGAAISWAQFTPSASPTYNNWNVHARLIDSAGAMGDAFRLNGSNNGAEGGAQLAVHADGSLAALWIKSEGALQKLVYRSFDASGLPTRTDRVLASTTGSLSDTQLVTLPDGSVMAVWHDSIPAEDPGLPWQRVAHFVQLDAAGTVQGFAFSPATTADVNSAQVLVLNDGRLFLSWAETTFDGFSTSVTRKAAFLTPDGTLSEAMVLIPAMTTGTPGFEVEELADGRLAVSWSVPDATGNSDTALQYFDPREAAISLLAGETAVRWWGTAFADSLTGGGAADRIRGGDGADTLAGLAGDDLLLGDKGNDLVRGGIGNDTLSGGAGNDTLQGGAGADHLTGGAGNDTLWGNAGADRFILQTSAGTDRVMDFTDGQDLIDLTAFGFATTGAALAAFSQTPEGALFTHGPSRALFLGLSLTSLDGADLLI